MKQVYQDKLIGVLLWTGISEFTKGCLSWIRTPLRVIVMVCRVKSTGSIEAAGGQIEVSRLWEERRLAYPIKGQRKGAYWITYFRLPTGALKDLTRQFEIHDGILRQLFIRLPGALVEPILEHARSGGVVRSTPVADVSEEMEEEEVGAT